MGVLAIGGQILKRMGSRVKPRILVNYLFRMVADAPIATLMVGNKQGKRVSKK